MSLMPMFFVSGENFLYQRQISIIQTNVTNLQVRVVLTPTSFDYSKVRADGSDIRFVAAYTDNGITSPLNYYTQVWDTAGTSIFWVKIPSSGTREMFMQYGRSSLTTTGSSGINDILNTGLRYRYYGYGGGASPTVPGGTLDGGGNDQVGPNYAFGGGTAVINDDVLGSFGSRADSVAIIWDGFVIPDGSGTYVFYTTSDDGQRLFIEDSLVIDNWVDQGDTERSYSYSWTDSRIKKIRYDWYENGGGATAKLGWDPITTGKVYGIPGFYLKAPKYSSAYADPYNYTGGVSSENSLFTPGFVTTNLIAYWDAARYAGSYPGTGTVMTDISGLNAQNLNLINGPAFSGAGGGSINLSGTNDYLGTPGALTTAGNSLTFEGWFNFDNVASGCFFGQGPTATNEGLHITFIGPNTIRFGMYSNDFDVTVSVSAGTWNHYAFTYLNTAPYTKKVYINGVLVGTSGTQTQWAGSGVFNVGATYSAAIATGNGKIGLARVYHTNLSDAQVLQNYTASRQRFEVPATSVEVDYLLVGAGGGGGGGDASSIGAAGGSGGAVTGTYALLTGDSLTVSVGGGGGGGNTQVTGSGSGSAGSSAVGAGGAGGNAGGTGTSGGGGGGGGGSFLRSGGTVIAAAGGGAGGGGGGEGDQENIGGGAGGGYQPRGVNGTNAAGAAGFNYSGDGGGGGGGGGGYYGGLGQQQGVSQIASGGANYHAAGATNTASFAGNTGGAATTTNTGAISVTNAANWGYGNDAGTGGGGKPGPTVGNLGISGSAGVVRIKYAGTVIRASGGTISTVSGYTVHTFTSDGTFTII